jgi:hypothetical protein
MSPESIAKQINAALPDVKAGSLRMWSEWFGRPYDNFHSIKRCAAVGSTLTVEFDGGETLTVENAEGLTISETAFSIRSASAVRWEWFYYGRSHVADNRYFYQFVRMGSLVEAQSNVDWYSPNFAPSAESNAVELL